MVSELNIAANNEWLSVVPPGSIVTTPPAQWISGDIAFSYDSRFNKIVMTGQNSSYTYIVAGNQDPNIATGMNALYNASGVYSPLTGFAAVPNPISNTTLNWRLGWTWTGQALTTGDFYAMIRPIPTSNPLPPNPPYASSTRSNYAQTYANLVNTACIYVYIDWIGGSAQDSKGNGGLLSVIPLNTANNSVGFYNKVTENLLTKIPPQLTEIRVLLKDEQGNDFFLPNTAIANFELGFSY